MTANVREALSRVMVASAIDDWLSKPNAGFDGFTPLELISQGRADQIFRAVQELESGTPN